MCNQNQGKEKKVSDPPYYLSDQSKSHKKKLEKVFITNQYYQHTASNKYFCPKIKLKKSLKQSSENSNI